MKCSGEAGKIN